MDWENEKITFDSERCITWCLNQSSTVYAVPEPKAREENLITRLSEIQTKDLSLRVKKLTLEARIPTKGSSQAAGHDLYAQETQKIPATGQGIIGTGIAIGLPSGTYGRIAPRSGLAIRHSLTVNAGVIDADYTGEIKVVLVNLGTEDYQVHKGDKIAQLIVERIISEEAILVHELETTTRGTKGFGSSDRRTPRPDRMTKQSHTGAELPTNQSWKVTGRSDTQGSHNQHTKEAERLLSEPRNL